MLNLDSNVCATEAIGLSVCWKAYAEIAYTTSIEMLGFNENSGYIWIYLDTGISIGSCMGNDAEFIVSDPDDGEEFFYRTYQDACDKLHEIYDQEEANQKK